WDFQERFDTTIFFPNQGASSDDTAAAVGVEDDHKKLLAHIDAWEDAAKASPRIFCGIFTHKINHSTRAIKETWASRCDGFVTFSDVADLELQTFKIKHEGPEEYGNMWQKSRAIWKYDNFHYRDDFDWFLLGGDDLFVIVENLRKYLLSDEIQRAAGGLSKGGTNPMYLGRRFRMFDENHRVFNSGGAAYALNQASLGVLAAHLDDDACHPHAETPWEDVMVAMCLHKNGVAAFDTRDALGRERFHPFTPAVDFGFRMPQEPEDRLVSGVVVGDWYTGWSIDLKFGRECCSRDSLSFHLVDEQLMERLYRLFYSCLEAPPIDLMVGPR
ncbi:unnamed protein product, partial [Pylaiella littoralis]